MKTSDKGKEIIKEFEGLRLTAYKCPAGVLTIGYGHTKGVTAGMKISKEQAETFLNEDLRPVEDAINKAGFNLSQNQFDAVASFVFNVGVNAFKNSTLYKMLAVNPQSLNVKAELLKWVKVKGSTLPGLIFRRQREIELYFNR